MPYAINRENIRLFYIDVGTGKPIVFVASAWLGSKMWESQIPYFVKQGFRCVAYDRRGHGRSDETWDGYDYDTLAGDLADLLDHLDLREVILVGHSAGCGEIVRYLTRYGCGRIDRIVLAAATTPFPMKTDDNPTGVDRGLMEADLAIRTSDRAKWYAENAGGFFGVGLPGVYISPEKTQFMIRQCLECSARAAYEFFLTGFTTDLRKDLEGIQVPALVIHGEHDMQAPLPLCGLRTAEMLSRSQLIVYETAAHGLFVTHADRFNTDILSFALQTTDEDAKETVIKMNNAHSISQS